ncbi:MAG: hypothetical protein HY898_06690 [Deltaproteobacteria bacterium]|nr:hypothetical protein [Deltaproteobacteria bacterium]
MLTSNRLRKHRVRNALFFAVALVLLLTAGPAWRHVRAMALLTRFSDPKAAGTLAGISRHDVVESKLDFESDGARIPARLYLPAGRGKPPGIVLAHGVHRLGIEEPRLRSFSRAIASAGIAVLTPEIRELADFRIDPRSIATLGAALRELRGRLDGRKVGLMGMSFAGGLSLMAAADDRNAPDLSFVVSVGGHDDLGRVLRFFVTNTIERPDGSTEHLHAHDYGALVLVYSRIESFFPPEDAPAAQEALRYWLWEEFDTARASEGKLSPASRARMDALFEHKLDIIRSELVAEIERQSPRFPSVSPSSCMSRIRVPIYLLHGAGDSVIPASETLWLASHAPRSWLAHALVSKAISHVELQGEPGWSDRMSLIHFMAGMLGSAEGS